MTYDRELRTEAAHALTHNQEVWSDRGYAVVTAGGLSEGDTDFELDVGPYDVLVGSTTQTSVGPTTLSVNAPDSDPYWLVVYVDGEGLQTEQGPEGEVFVGDQSVVASNADVREITSPAPPTLADIGPVTILGKVLVTSSGVSDSLIDDRVFQSERVFETIDANAVTTDELSVDNTLKSAGGDEDLDEITFVGGLQVFLAKGDYTTNRSIENRVTMRGINAGGQGTSIKAAWTVDDVLCYLEGLLIGDGGSLTINSGQCRLHNVSVAGGQEITISGDNCLLSTIFGFGDVTFEDGTSGGEIGITAGSLSITDNGNNSIL